MSQNPKFTVMKTLIKKTAAIIILLAIVITVSSGQEYIRLERSKTLQLSKKSEKTEVIIKVTGDYNYVRIKVQGQVHKGDILVELIDPAGEVRRDFTIKTGSAAAQGISLGAKGYVAGEMEKAYRDPENGNWLVRVTPEDAEGQLKVYSLLIYNPRTNLIELEQIEKDTDAHIG